MTDTFPDKKPDNKTPSGFAPEISTLKYKKTINLIPKLAFFGGVVLVLAFLLYSYFKDLASELLFGTEPPKKAMVHPEIVQKEFSFKKHREEDKVVDVVKRDVKHPSIPKEKSQAKFQKYKSIPIKSAPTDISPTTTTTATVEPKDKSQDTTEMAVVAEPSFIDPNFLIPEGTYIPCSLNTKFTSDVTGRITCTITEDIYSANGAVKLIERGTKAIGTYQGGNLKHGAGRMFVIWTKLRTPDFKLIKLVDSQVVGQLGESGIDGWVDSHFFERFGGALLLSTAKDILKMTQENQNKGNNNTTVDVSTMDETRSAFVAIIEKMLENSINIPPTLYKNQGDIIGITVGRDIDFSKVYVLEMNK